MSRPIFKTRIYLNTLVARKTDASNCFNISLTSPPLLPHFNLLLIIGKLSSVNCSWTVGLLFECNVRLLNWLSISYALRCPTHSHLETIILQIRLKHRYRMDHQYFKRRPNCTLPSHADILFIDNIYQTCASPPVTMPIIQVNNKAQYSFPFSNSCVRHPSLFSMYTILLLMKLWSYLP